MIDLSKHTELTDITFDHDNAHLAVTHVSQGYSANGRPDALLFKSSKPINKAVSASLEDIYGKEAVVKMTADNKRRYLEELVTSKLRESFPEREYLYTWVVDYNEDMVAFNFDDEGLWAVDYSVEEESGAITLGDSPRKVLRTDIYMEADTGEILIKANVFKELPSEDEESEDGEIKTGGSETPLTEEETLDMSEEVKVEDLMKSAEAQEMLKAMAKEMAEAQFEELQKAAKKEELIKSTSEIVKGFEGVAEDSVEAVVKGLVEMDQSVAGVLLKAMGDMQESLVQKSAEIEQVKKEFGEKQVSVEAEVEVKHKAVNRTQELASVVNKMKNK